MGMVTLWGLGFHNRTEFLVLLTMAAVTPTEAPEKTPVPCSSSALLQPPAPSREPGRNPVTVLPSALHTPHLSASRRSPEQPMREEIPISRVWGSGLDILLDETHQRLSQQPPLLIFNLQSVSLTLPARRDSNCLLIPSMFSSMMALSGAH